MATSTHTIRKTIRFHASFFEAMKEQGFFRWSEWMTTEMWLSDLHFGENWFSNGVVEFKILRDEFGQDEFVNFRSLKHDMIEALAAAA